MRREGCSKRPSLERTQMNSSHNLFIVTGLPATGKTTFARRLASSIRGCLIDIDIATEPIVQAAMEKITNNRDDRDSPTFKQTFRNPIYTTLFDLADSNLPHTSVVLTGPFTKESDNPDWPLEIQERLLSTCKVICFHLHCSDELRKRRLAKRANPRDRAKLTDWEQHSNYYQPYPKPSYPHISIDTGTAIEFDLTAFLENPGEHFA